MIWFVYQMLSENPMVAAMIFLAIFIVAAGVTYQKEKT
jgi:hypothetical protein